MVIVLLSAVLYSPPVSMAASPPNLIQNPSLETPNSGNPALPDQWTTGGFGTNDRTFTYPVAGMNGGNAARVNITSYTDGDAKWIFNNVPVTAGQQYAFQDNYTANVPTVLAIQYSDASGTVSYDPNFVGVPSASSTWETASVAFTPPAGAVSITIFHLLNSVGSLTVDNYSLIEVPPPTPFNQGFVSLTFDDGLKSQLNNAMPILDAAGFKSTFYIITHVSAGFTVPTSTPESVLADTVYAYTDQYTSSANSQISAQVTLTDNSVVNADVVDNSGNTIGSNVTLPPAPSSTQALVNFYIPSTAKTVTVSHSLVSNGSLDISNASFGAQNYMTLQDELNLQSDGQEVGAHTQTHPDLTSLSSTDAQTQINGSRTDLLNNGLSPVLSFNYPYGNNNSSTQQMVHDAGFTSARTVTPGFNGKDANQFALLAQSVNASTTLSQVQTWIDDAMAHKTWLILVLHDIIPDTTNSPYASTPSMLQNIVNYLKTNNVPVRTVGQGLDLINGSTVTPPSTTTKSISLNTGWNLITLPIQPLSPTSSLPINYSAETFGQMAGADVITQWLATGQQYNSHIVGLPVGNFDITNGMGFFVHMAAPKNISITGTEISQTAPVLSTGWNLLGWTNNASTTADTFESSLSGSDVASSFNSSNQQWISHIVNLPINNFTINQGDGVFVHKP